jgi:hypothetical protein
MKIENGNENVSVNGPHPLSAAADAKDGPPGKSDAKGQATCHRVYQSGTGRVEYPHGRNRK